MASIWPLTGRYFKSRVRICFIHHNSLFSAELGNYRKYLNTSALQRIQAVNLTTSPFKHILLLLSEVASFPHLPDITIFLRRWFILQQPIWTSSYTQRKGGNGYYKTLMNGFSLSGLCHSILGSPEQTQKKQAIWLLCWPF
jgi:hypothetical protein